MEDLNVTEKKNYSLGKTIINSLFCILLLLSISFGIYKTIDYFFTLNLIGDEIIEIGVNKVYLESGAIAKLFDKKIDNVVIDGEVDTDKLGKYTIKYTSNLLFLNREVSRTVFVKDLEKPTIELKGNKYVYVNLGEQYTEQGYTAVDNVDKDITDKVTINTELDTNTSGEYVIKYVIKDSSDNENFIERYVEVVNYETILQSPLEDFNLDNTFNDVLFEYDPNNEYDFFNDITFLGDSNVLYLHQRGQYITNNQAWGRLNLNIAQINSSTFTTLINGNDSTLDNALTTYKPKYLMVSIGINAALYMNKDVVLSEAQKLIDNIKTNYPDTKLIFSAIFPVYTGTLEGSLQNTINQYNYYVLELCHKNKIPFVNFSDRVKDESGYASHEYFECTVDTNCGFHLNEKGKEYYINYIKHLNLERDLI